MCKAFYAPLNTIVIETKSWPSGLTQFSLFKDLSRYRTVLEKCLVLFTLLLRYESY